jgi:hypothetical protein
LSELARPRPPLLSRRSAFRVALALIAAAASGCGGTGSSHPLSKAQYEHKVQRIQQDVFAKVNPATILLGARGGDPTAGLRAVQEASAKEADELGRITPPAEIAQAHKSLVTALRRYGDELSGIIAAVHKRKLSGQDLRAKLRSLASVKSIRAARVAIAQKGYNIGPA